MVTLVTTDFATQIPFTFALAREPHSPTLGPRVSVGLIPSQAAKTDHMTQDWLIRALRFISHCDWFPCGHVTQIKPVRMNQSELILDNFFFSVALEPERV